MNIESKKDRKSEKEREGNKNAMGVKITEKERNLQEEGGTDRCQTKEPKAPVDHHTRWR